MDPQGQFIAAILDSSLKGFASSAIARLDEEDAAVVSEWGFGNLVGDLEVRLQSLAEALAAGRSEVFELDLEWMASTYTARGVSTDVLERSLESLRHELEERLPGDSTGMACRYVDAGLVRLRSSKSTPHPALTDENPHVDLARQFLVAVLEGRRAECERLVLNACDRGLSVSEVHRFVIAAAQAELGRMWQVGDVHVAEEHLASRIVEDVLTALRSRMPKTDDAARRVLVASVRGNMHEIGARMVADHFELSGWRAFFLGADTPNEDLVVSVGHFGVQLVALSAGLGLHVRACAELVSEIHRRFPDVPVLVGGQTFSRIPDLWKTVGADGFALCGAGAVEEARRLVG